jgi:mono/diheme cytochrome c family protein
MKIRLALVVLLGISIGLSQAKRSVWDGVYTEEQAKRGQERYQNLCASCHGDSLEGGESAPPLAGGSFLANWNTLSVGELFDRTRSTMPQSKPGSLSREANAEIMAYLLSANQFPAGKDALPQQSEVLKEIRIEAVKPDRK